MKNCLIQFFASFALVTFISAAELLTTPPDLKSNRTVSREQTYNLGATGLRGWIFTRAASNLDGGQGRTTAQSRQILVTHVGAKSPADGILRVDDVILGVGGKLFTDDARKSLAMAIQEAEKTENLGVLNLKIWRDDKEEDLAITLRVMGSYTATAPFGCAKSKLIFDEACKILEQEPLKKNWCGAVCGLALLATGDPKHLPKLQEFAYQIGPETLDVQLKDGMVIWDWAHSRQVKAKMPDSTGEFRVRLSRATCLGSGSNAINSARSRALMSRNARRSYSFS